MTDRTWPLWRSMLYVPADRPSFIAKAGQRGADAVILDLEDGVAPAAKDTARTAIPDAAAAIAGAGVDVLVRVNRDDNLLDGDLEAAVGPHVTAIVLPKCDDPELVTRVARMLDQHEDKAQLERGHTRIFVRIEGPRGLQSCQQILAASGRIAATALGLADLTAAMGWTDQAPILVATTNLFVAARAAGVMPLGLVTTIDEYRDLDLLKQQAERARSLGSHGTPCIHPAQIPILNAAFAPTDEEIRWARDVLSAWDDKQRDGIGAFEHEGDFIDAAVVRRAKNLLEMHQTR